MSEIRIIAIDPGGIKGVTGVAVLDATLEGWASIGDKTQIKGPLARKWALSYFPYVRELEKDVVIVCEDFIKRPEHKSGKWDPLLEAKDVGYFNGLADVCGIHFILQKPDERTVIQRRGSFPKFPYNRRHYADALAHGLVFWERWRITRKQ